MHGIPGQARNDNIEFRCLGAKTNQHVVHFSCWKFFCSNFTQSGFFGEAPKNIVS